MLKFVSFATFTLLATLTATHAAIRSAIPDLVKASAVHEIVDLVKPRTPPRRPLGPTKHKSEGDLRTLQGAGRILATSGFVGLYA